MKVTVVGIEDLQTAQVRTQSRLGELVVTWRGAAMPAVGDHLDVELDFGIEDSKWNEDVVGVADDASVGIELADGLFYATGLGDYAGDRILYLRLAPDCLLSLVLDVAIG